MASDPNGSVGLAPASAPVQTDEIFDLLPKLLPYFDRHLIYPLIEFLINRKQSDGLDATEEQDLLIKLLKPTNMMDFVGDLEKNMKGLDERPQEYADKNEQIQTRRRELGEKTANLLEILENPDITSNLRSDKLANMNYLKENHDITTEEVALLYDYGQLMYSFGDYASASDMLFNYRLLYPDNDLTTTATWGKLACEILVANWEVAMEEINKLKDAIDTRFFNAPLAQLYNRTWLLHWALFPLFHHDSLATKDAVIEMFFSPSYINTIQTSCPWLLRYLAASVISGRNRTTSGKNLSSGGSTYQKQVKDLVRVVRQESYEYRDPVTEFLRALYVDFDFEEAQRKLSTAYEVMHADFFLQDTAEPFVEAARHLISESYCKIHQRIDIKDLSTRLGLNQDEGEKWIVNLIRDTRVDAKIDYKEGTVVMNHPPQSVYQQVIERTKGGFFRTQVLSAAVAR